MTLFYIANMRFPTERAHGAQVAHMCAAFARQGIQVTLLVPDRKTFSEDPHAYYGVERNFTIEKISVWDVVRFGPVGFLIESLVFAYRAAKRIPGEDGTPLNPPSQEGGRETIVYTREELPLLFLPRRSTFYEAHQLRRSYFLRRLIRRARRVVAISQGLKDALVQNGLPEERILVARDGYDEKQFAERISKEEARKRLGLPQGTKIAMYIGGLEPWKGAETLCNAAALLAKDDVLVVIVGGAEEEVRRFKPKYPAVRFLGARPYRDLAVNQQAADILVVPNSARTELGSQFTSPLKLFAHMASGVAVAVADVPALREVVTSSEAFTFTPDDPRSLADTVARALSSGGLLELRSKAQAAEKRAHDFNWDKRARLVVYFIGTFPV